MMPNRRQAVRDRANADSLDVVGVVARTSVVVVFPVLDAIVYQDREKRHRHVLGIESFDHVVATELDLNEILQLYLKRLLQILK